MTAGIFLVLYAFIKEEVQVNSRDEHILVVVDMSGLNRGSVVLLSWQFGWLWGGMG